MNSKCIRIDDYVTIPFGMSYMRCPINRVMMTDRDLKKILMNGNKPVHIYAINLKDSKESVLITMDNYMKTNDELFNTVKEEVTTKTETYKINVGSDISAIPVEDIKPEKSTEPITEIVEDVVEPVEDVKPEVVEPVVTDEKPVETVESSVEDVKSEETTESVEEVVEKIEEVKQEPVEKTNTKYQNNTYNGYVRQNKKKK